MSETPKDMALQRLAELDAEARNLREFVALYERLEIEALVMRGPPPAPPPGEFATKGEIAAAVRDILRGETQPMHISFLYKQVTARGLRISGKNPKGNLSAKLAPFRDIVYVKDKGWLLRSCLPQKDEAPNSPKLNGASVTGEVGASPDSNPATSGA